MTFPAYSAGRRYASPSLLSYRSIEETVRGGCVVGGAGGLAEIAAGLTRLRRPLCTSVSLSILLVIAVGSFSAAAT